MGPKSRSPAFRANASTRRNCGSAIPGAGNRWNCAARCRRNSTVKLAALRQFSNRAGNKQVAPFTLGAGILISQEKCGDNVIIINAGKAVLTGKKASQKFYRTHSGWVGGLKETPQTGPGTNRWLRSH